MKRVIFGLLLLLLVGCSDSGPLHRVALDPSWYPQDFMGKEPEINGFSEAVLRAAAEEKDFSVEVIKAGPEFLEWGLGEGKWEAILTSLSPAVNYEGRYTFSDPYLLIGPVVVVPVGSSISSVKDLQGKTVGVMRGSSAVALLAEEVPGIVIVAYDSPALALQQLLTGRYEAVLMPILMAGTYVSDLYSDRLKIVTKPLTNESLRLVALSSSEELVEEFNKGLSDIQGRHYQALLTEWNLYQ